MKKYKVYANVFGQTVFLGRISAKTQKEALKKSKSRLNKNVKIAKISLET